MEDLLYDEFDFSQYDPLANINAILVEIAQKSLDIKEVATEMEGFGNASPDKVAQMDIIEQEIQELKKRADYYLAHLTKLWHDRLWEDIYSLVSHIIVNKNTIRVEFDYRGFNYAQIEIEMLLINVSMNIVWSHMTIITIVKDLRYLRITNRYNIPMIMAM